MARSYGGVGRMAFSCVGGLCRGHGPLLREAWVGWRFRVWVVHVAGMARSYGNVCLVRLFF